jgi:hypothetical protein
MLCSLVLLLATTVAAKVDAKDGRISHLEL